MVSLVIISHTSLCVLWICIAEDGTERSSIFLSIEKKISPPNHQKPKVGNVVKVYHTITFKGLIARICFFSLNMTNSR